MIRKMSRRKVSSPAKRLRWTFWKHAFWNIVSQGYCFLLLWGMCEAAKIIVGCKTTSSNSGFYEADFQSVTDMMNFSEIATYNPFREIYAIKHDCDDNGTLSLYVALRDKSIHKITFRYNGWWTDDSFNVGTKPQGLCLYDGRIYWTEKSGDKGVFSVLSTDGSSQHKNFSCLDYECWGIEADRYERYLYWGDSGGNIKRSSLDTIGSNSTPTPWLTLSDTIYSLTIDTKRKVVYVARDEDQTIRGFILDSTLSVSLIQGVDRVKDITVIGDFLIYVDKTQGLKAISLQNDARLITPINTTGDLDCQEFYSIHAIADTVCPDRPSTTGSSPQVNIGNSVKTTTKPANTQTRTTGEALTTSTGVNTGSTITVSSTPGLDGTTGLTEDTSRTSTQGITGTTSAVSSTPAGETTRPTTHESNSIDMFGKKIEEGTFDDVDDMFVAWEELISEYPDFLADTKQQNYDYMDIWVFEGDMKTVSLINEDKSFDVQLMFPDNTWGDSSGNALVASVLTTKVNLQEDASDVSGHFEIGSHVLSLNPYNANKEKISYAAKEPFCFTIKLLSEFKSRNETITTWCQFLTANTKWSPDGCGVNDENESHVTCCCDHMTSFAVLMQLVDIEIPRQHQEALAYVTYIAMSMSIICLIATITLYIVFKLVKKQRVIIHINLAVSLILAQLIFVTGVNAKEKVACSAVTIVLHYLWLVVFMWMLVEGIHLYLKVNPSIRWRIKLPMWAPIAWGVPAVIAFVTFGIGNSEYGDGENRGCWLPLTDWLHFAFVVPALLITVISTVILIIVIRKFLALKTNQDRNERERMKAGVRAMCFLLPILGVTWIFGVLQLDATSSIVFSYLFNIGNGLQGVFIFITQGLMDEEIKVFIQRKWRGGRVDDESNNTNEENG